ncbi:MAG: hypothetical protein K6A42_04080 [Treponema sp.]|nr:hypothetical protein [Treponema sp.]
MNKTQKFSSDIQRIKKRNRNGSAFNLSGALKDLESLFVSQNPHCKVLAQSLFDWWKNDFARGPEIEDEAAEKLTELQAFLNGEEGNESLSQEDWRRVKEEVGYEAENLPLDLLSQMMKTVVEKGAME